MYYVIVNPKAGKGAGEHCAPAIEEFLKGCGAAYELAFSQYAGHPEVLASQALKAANCDRVWAVGGDGTISEVASALAGSSAVLCVIPVGNGNDFIKAAGIPSKLSDALRCAVGPTRTIDMGKVNGKYFINIAGMGFDADVAAGVGVYTAKGVTGLRAYLMSLLSTVKTFNARPMHIDADGEHMDVNCIMADAANGRFIGGGIKICPHAKLDDGLLDVCIIKDVHKLLLPYLLPFVVMGWHTKLLKRFCLYMKVKRITITAAQPLNIQADGNLSQADGCTFEIVEKGLEIAAP